MIEGHDLNFYNENQNILHRGMNNDNKSIKTKSKKILVKSQKKIEINIMHKKTAVLKMNRERNEQKSIDDENI